MTERGAFTTPASGDGFRRPASARQIVAARPVCTGLKILLGFLVGLLLGLATFAFLLAAILLACRCAEEWMLKEPAGIEKAHEGEG